VLSKALVHATSLLRARQAVILCYHGVGPSDTRIDPGFLRVRTAVFRMQLELLLEGGFEFVTVAELVQRARGGEPPSGLAALTFDDGMDDNHAVVMPILTELGLPATIYVVTGLIGRRNPWMGERAGARMMTEPELAELAAAGFEIGAHTVSHPDLSQLDFEACRREMTESRDVLEQLLGLPVRTFAYPYCRYGLAALGAARASGFSAAVTCHGQGSWDPYELRRSMITGKDGLATFLMKLTELYQPVFDSGPARLARATTRRPRDVLRERRRAQSS
jgi:peptidoglycan/xylan/chitin deacetylase (PgdA/CDA1 family)